MPPPRMAAPSVHLDLRIVSDRHDQGGRAEDQDRGADRVISDDLDSAPVDAAMAGSRTGRPFVEPRRRDHGLFVTAIPPAPCQAVRVTPLS